MERSGTVERVLVDAAWPAEGAGFHWAVEARAKQGWRRFTEHHYQRA